MKYFTKELWIEAQDPDLQDENSKAWESAGKAYEQQLDLLANRISPEAFEFFKNASIHDGNLVSAYVLDGRHFSCSGEKETFNPDPVSASLTIQNHDQSVQWALNYKNIRRAVIDFPSDQPIFYSEGEGFSDVGYHELIDAGQGFLRHELLFSSGASILFEFKHVTVMFQAV